MNVGLAWLIAVSISTTTAADVVHQRGGKPSLEGTITRLDDEGVTIDTTTSVTLVRWDWVRSVESEKDDAEVERREAFAELLWRARTRLERHDAAMAEPLFDRLFESTRGQTSAIALIVAEGVLRCRLSRGAMEAAVIPALETIRLRRAVPGVSDIYATLPPILDERTWLCTELPPVWLDSTALITVERTLEAYHAGNDVEVAAMAYWYRRSARQALSLRIEADEAVPQSTQPGIARLRDIVTCASHDATERGAARTVLLSQFDSSPNWMQAWLHYAVGMSLLTEQDVAQHQQGLVHLAHLPVRLSTVQPLLAGVALAKLAEWCDAVGESEAAASLRHDLATRFPQVAALFSRRSSGASVASPVISTKDAP